MHVDPKGLVRVIKYVAEKTAQYFLHSITERLDTMSKQITDLTEAATSLNQNVTKLGSALDTYIAGQQEVDLTPIIGQLQATATSLQAITDKVVAATKPADAGV
jgi:hypothetical protein